MVGALNSTACGLGVSPGWWHCVVFLDKRIHSHSALFPLRCTNGHHRMRSVLLISVKILPYRPPARLIRTKSCGITIPWRTPVSTLIVSDGWGVERCNRGPAPGRKSLKKKIRTLFVTSDVKLHVKETSELHSWKTSINQWTDARMHCFPTQKSNPELSTHLWYSFSPLCGSLAALSCGEKSRKTSGTRVLLKL